MIEDLPHILVVDDDKRLRDLLGKYLADNDFLVSAAESAEAARKKLTSLTFDLIVLDLMMPGETGLDLAKSLRQTGSDVPILMLTAMGEPDDRITGLEHGADDYLVKPFEPRELLLRIGNILRRLPQKIETPEEIQLGDVAFNYDREELRRGEIIIRLTATETALLKALVENPEAILSREELSRRVGGADSSDRTVDVQVTRLRKKIEPDPKQPRYLQTVRGQGYRLRPD